MGWLLPAHWSIFASLQPGCRSGDLRERKYYGDAGKEDSEEGMMKIAEEWCNEWHENINSLLPDELLILSKYDFTEPKYIPKPKYNHPPIIFMILDDLIGNNDVFKRNNSLIGNITIKHRHLGINLIFTTQNPKSKPNIIRNNIDLWFLYKFANIKMVIEKVFEEVIECWTLMLTE